MRKYFISFGFLLLAISSYSNTGYDLWLGYNTLSNDNQIKEYVAINKELVFEANTDMLIAAQNELQRGLTGLLGKKANLVSSLSKSGVIVFTADDTEKSEHYGITQKLAALNEEGYLIQSVSKKGNLQIVIAGKTERGVLYGIFNYLRLMQTEKTLKEVNIIEEPKLTHRVLNHWDNLDGTIERGYAGYTLWQWDRLPSYISDRYTDYARANASIGINGAVLNNVNANARSLKTDYLVKTAALANVLRPYGIKVYLTARFSAPREIGGLKTADPMDPNVKEWWNQKINEIYELIPDFGGFLLKANSEGQPGPQDYGRTHADGANMFADLLEPYGGVVMWRAFVYENNREVDRVTNGYQEFKPLDGEFRKNVFVQPKNGPIDFQPREPFHPLFGGMPKTSLALEFQITQENLGHSGHLVYLGSLFEETLQSETYEKGKGTTVSKVLQNYKETHGIAGLAGVSNIGTDLNWTGHLFGQANWHAFGRMAWNPDLKAKELSEEWIRMTFSNDQSVLAPIQKIMLMSREAAVNYMMPLGLNHIMNFHSHNGPEPWHDDPLWTAYDYHKITNEAIGVDRTSKGSNAVGQYHSPLREQFDDIKSCPTEFLLWFHRVPWTYKMASGKNLWNEIVDHYYTGVKEVETMQSIWKDLENKIDKERFNHTQSLLQHQYNEAVWWRDACLLFFQSYSKMPIPDSYEQPKHSLEYYKKIPFPYDWDKTRFFEK